MKKIKVLIAVVTITAAVLNTATAQTIQNTSKKNPFGLVYDGAITENVKGQVNIQPVTY
jgi:uncharacterized protein